MQQREVPKQQQAKDEWADDDDDINVGLWFNLIKSTYI